MRMTNYSADEKMAGGCIFGFIAIWLGIIAVAVTAWVVVIWAVIKLVTYITGG